MPAEAVNADDLRARIAAANHEELVLMLYDGAIRMCAEARQRMAEGAHAAKHDLLIRAQNIVLELLYSLDRKAGGEMASNLASLYTTIYNRLVEANVHDSLERLDEAAEGLKGLRVAWAEAMERAKEAKSG